MKIATALSLAAVLALPYAALAQTKGSPADMAYCKAMVDKYRKEVGMNAASGDVPAAAAKCEAGDTAAGIPVLERSLKDNKVALPPRG